MRINVNPQVGNQSLNNFLKLTKHEETQQQLNKRLRDKVLDEVFG